MRARSGYTRPLLEGAASLSRARSHSRRERHLRGTIMEACLNLSIGALGARLSAARFVIALLVTSLILSNSTSLAATPPATPAAATAKPATGSKPAASTAPAPANTAAKPPAHKSSSSGHQELDRIAAVVNDEVVLQSDVDEQVYLFLQRNNVRPDSGTVDTLRRQVLDQMISEKLIVAEAKRQGMTASPTEVNRQLDQAVAEAKQRLGSEQAFREQLAKENMTEDQLREKYRGEIERQIMAQRLVQKQLPQRTVPQAEAEAFFAAHPEKFPKFGAQVRLSVIQIPIAADSATTAKGKASAIAARKRIADGEKFAKVAAEVSEDPGSARAGGDLGYFPRGTMDPAFEEVVFSIPLNTLSEPVHTAFGWHLIEVLDRDTLRTVARKDSVGPDGKPILEAHARHILLRVQVGDADAERARKVADHVYDEARKGTDFAALVRRYSHYTGQSGEGGDIGLVSLSSLQESIRNGIDSLETGQVSEPLANAVGYNIFKVTDRKAERPYTLEEIKKDLPQVVEELQQRERYDAWVKTLRAKAHVEIRS
jgi:peptidyl-prolyl cis-trans isomerase SurA